LTITCGNSDSGILHAPGPDDFRLIVRRRPPKDGLVHPVGFPEEFPAQAEGLEHLDRAACHAIRLTYLKRTPAAIDDACRDAGKG
jgi:hypothetical protein